jgi:hypothetical protein
VERQKASHTEKRGERGERGVLLLCSGAGSFLKNKLIIVTISN